jgi:hypothetical protein
MGCLALNASFEPLTIVPAPAGRAAGARPQGRDPGGGRGPVLPLGARRRARARGDPAGPLRARAEALPAGRSRTPSCSLATTTAANIAAATGASCAAGQFLTRDHIRARSRGADSTVWANVVTCCSPCNNRKGNQLPEEAGSGCSCASPFEPNYVHLVWVVRRVTYHAGQVHPNLLWGRLPSTTSPCGRHELSD